MLRFTNQPIPREPKPQLHPDRLIVLRTVRNGMPLKVLDEAIRRGPLTKKEWFKYLQLSRPTYQRIRNGKTNLTTYQAERIILLTDFHAKGTKTLDGTFKFRKWLKQPSSYLPNITRMDLLDTSFGIEVLYDELEMVRLYR